MVFAFVRSDSELDHDVVEAADRPGGLRQGVAVHPDDSEVPRIGQTRSRCRRPNELRRDRDADDFQLRQSSVDDCRQGRAGDETPRLGEGFAQNDLVGTSRFDLPSGLDPGLVELRFLGPAHRDEVTDDRLGARFDHDPEVADDAPLDGRDAR